MAARYRTSISRSVSRSGHMYVYINLKGRDPEGIVEPADYEKVQQQIIRCAAHVCRSCHGHAARLAGPVQARCPHPWPLWRPGGRRYLRRSIRGLRASMAIFCPPLSGDPVPLKGSLRLTGRALRKAYRLERNCNLIDIVPTICYLMDLPLPAQAEGAVLYQAFKDPDFKAKEINKLKDGLARMETALTAR